MKLIFSHLAWTWLSILSVCIQAQEKSALESDVTVNEHRMHYRIIGSGTSTLVLDVGIGETYRDWLPFLDRLPDNIKVFCYDRAGYGQSQIGTLPRDSNTEAAELKTLLEKAGVKGPYILVGHSLGAMNLQLFASQNLKEVAGILLLDPPPLDWILGNRFPALRTLADQTTATFENLSQTMGNSSDPGDRQRADFFRTLASEHGEMFSSSGKQVAAASPFGDIPLIVIASGRANPQMGEEAESFQEFWNDQCRQLAGKSTNGRYERAVESSHHIHLDDPDIVWQAINELVSESDH